MQLFFIYNTLLFSKWNFRHNPLSYLDLRKIKKFFLDLVEEEITNINLARYNILYYISFFYISTNQKNYNMNYLSMFAGLQSMAQNEEIISETGAEASEITLNFIDLAFKGGWIMIPIFALSIIAIWIFFERFHAIRRASKKDDNFMNRIKDYIHEGKIDSAVSLCESNDTPVSRMISKGVKRIGRPLNDVNAAIENIGNLEVSKLEKNLPTLATVAGAAPMIGFLGTVMGMIQAFYAMANAGNNIDVSLLANGIYTAMVTTVAGLVVGIIAYFAYNILVAKVEKVVFTMEATTTEFMDLLNEPIK